MPDEPEEEDPDDLDPRLVEEPEAVLPRPSRTRVFAVVNQKGGVGKTTTAVNLAAALGMAGLRVLVLDVDPQGNASTALGIDHGSGVMGTYEVLVEQTPISEVVQKSPEAPNLWLVPATIDLAAAELELVSAVSRETRLKRALSGYLAEAEFDYVLMDCPPSLGLLTLNALVAADEILIPIQCEYYALEGVQHLQRTIESVVSVLNPGLSLSTILLTMHDGRTRLSSEVAENVRQYFPTQTLETMVPRSVRVAEAPSFGQSVLTYQPNSAGAVAYLKAAEEIAHRAT
ncbi:ParA family protein [Enemella sp. A6]|uniref:ParA family protein n=1 Tax=Enemella sp. A6 TaxID=3440152 RepID=UPI003EB885FC